MRLYSFNIVLLTLLFINSIKSESDIPSKKHREIYAFLLNGILQKNQHRWLDLQRQMELQDYSVKHGRLPVGDEGVSYTNGLVPIVRFGSLLSANRRTQPGTSKGSNLNEDQTKSRRTWSNSCSKNAARRCKRACIRAFKNVCYTYKCARRVKRRYRRECRRTCRNKFVYDKYYSDGYSSDDSYSE